MQTPLWQTALWGLAVFTAIGIAFGLTLAAVARRFHVPTNPLVDRVREALESGDRALAGTTAPARGLCLMRVGYPDDLGGPSGRAGGPGALW